MLVEDLRWAVARVRLPIARPSSCGVGIIARWAFEQIANRPFVSRMSASRGLQILASPHYSAKSDLRPIQGRGERNEPPIVGSCQTWSERMQRCMPQRRQLILAVTCHILWRVCSTLGRLHASANSFRIGENSCLQFH